MYKFLNAQKKRIEIEKWLEGERNHKDPGHEFVIEWIKHNAAWFREKWQVSLCQSCIFAAECGYEVRQSCIKYEKYYKDQI